MIMEFNPQTDFPRKGFDPLMSEQITLYKLMILYMLDNVDFSLTYTHLSDFILGRGYTDYFNLQAAVSELEEADLIHAETIRSTTYYMITPDGEETIGYFRSKINLPIREDIDAWLKENRLSMIDNVSVISDYYRLTSGDYEVQCRIREKKSTICDIRLTVADLPAAEAVCRQWKEKSQPIYAYLMKELMK